MGRIDRSIHPGLPVPATVLVAIMHDGSYLLVGYPEGAPSAFVVAEEAASLRRALDLAFGGARPADQDAVVPHGDFRPGTAARP